MDVLLDMELDTQVNNQKTGESQGIITEEDVLELTKSEILGNGCILQVSDTRDKIEDIIDDEAVLDVKRFEVDKKLKVIVNDFYDIGEKYTLEDLGSFIKKIYKIGGELKDINGGELLKDQEGGWISDKYINNDYFFILIPLYHSIQSEINILHGMTSIEYKEKLRNAIIGLLSGNYESGHDIINLYERLNVIYNGLKKLEE